MLKREIRENWVRENPCVAAWLQRVASSTRRRYCDYLYRYFQWLRENGGEFSHKTPSELLDLQDKTTGRDRFKQLDLLQRFVSMQPGAFNTKHNIYSTVRSFYDHNRVPLPKDIGFRIRSDRETVNGELDVEGLKKIVLASNLRYRAVFLCMFQSAMGEAEFEYFNRAWDQVKPQLEDGKKRLKINLPGRKHARNERPYYTFIGKDGVKALTEYIEKERGFIKLGEAIFLNDKLKPVTKANVRIYFHRMAEKAGLIKKPYPKCPECGADTIRRRRRPGRRGHQRYGKTVYHCTNPKCGIKTPASREYHLPKTIRYKVHAHEMRDLFRSEWDLSAAKGVCAEFFMGHNIDPNMYNKIMKLHPEWSEEQYALAEPFLNVISQDPRKVSLNKFQQLEQKIVELEKRNVELKERLNGYALSDSQVADLLKRIERLEKQAQKQK